MVKCTISHLIAYMMASSPLHVVKQQQQQQLLLWVGSSRYSKRRRWMRDVCSIACASRGLRLGGRSSNKWSFSIETSMQHQNSSSGRPSMRQPMPATPSLPKKERHAPLFSSPPSLYSFCSLCSCRNTPTFAILRTPDPPQPINPRHDVFSPAVDASSLFRVVAAPATNTPVRTAAATTAAATSTPATNAAATSAAATSGADTSAAALPIVGFSSRPSSCSYCSCCSSLVSIHPRSCFSLCLSSSLSSLCQRETGSLHFRMFSGMADSRLSAADSAASVNPSTSQASGIQQQVLAKKKHRLYSSMVAASGNGLTLRRVSSGERRSLLNMWGAPNLLLSLDEDSCAPVRCLRRSPASADSICVTPHENKIASSSSPHNRIATSSWDPCPSSLHPAAAAASHVLLQGGGASSIASLPRRRRYSAVAAGAGAVAAASTVAATAASAVAAAGGAVAAGSIVAAAPVAAAGGDARYLTALLPLARSSATVTTERTAVVGPHHQDDSNTVSSSCREGMRIMKVIQSMNQRRCYTVLLNALRRDSASEAKKNHHMLLLLSLRRRVAKYHGEHTYNAVPSCGKRCRKRSVLQETKEEILLDSTCMHANMPCCNSSTSSGSSRGVSGVVSSDFSGRLKSLPVAAGIAPLPLERSSSSSSSEEERSEMGADTAASSQQQVSSLTDCATEGAAETLVPDAEHLCMHPPDEGSYAAVLLAKIKAETAGWITDSTLVNCLTDFLLAFKTTLDIPWAIALPLLGGAVRLATLPFAVSSERDIRLRAAYGEKMTALQAAAEKAKANGLGSAEFKKAQKTLKTFLKKHNLSLVPLSIFQVLLIGLVVSLTTPAIRNISGRSNEFPHFATEHPAWVESLAMPDSTPMTAFVGTYGMLSLIMAGWLVSDKISKSLPQQRLSSSRSSSGSPVFLTRVIPGIIASCMTIYAGLYFPVGAMFMLLPAAGVQAVFTRLFRLRAIERTLNLMPESVRPLHVVYSEALRCRAPKVYQMWQRELEAKNSTPTDIHSQIVLLWRQKMQQDYWRSSSRRASYIGEMKGAKL